MTAAQVTRTDIWEWPAGRLHPLSVLTGLVVAARQLLPALITALFLSRDNPEGLRFLAIPAVVGVGFQFLSWRKFTFGIGNGTLIVDQGVIQRSHREIPIDRVHQVEEVIKLQHRLLGLVSLKVDSGGSGSTAEISLDALGRRDATRLREILDSYERASNSTVGPAAAQFDPPEPAAPLVRIGIADLALAGITNSPFAATLTLVGGGVQFIDEIVGDEAFGRTAEWVFETVGNALVTLGALAVTWIALSATASVFANYGFQLEKSGHELRVERGLLDKRRAVLDLRRLTAVRIEQTLIRRALGLCAVRLRTVSGSGSDNNSVSSISIPILQRAQLNRVLGELLPVASPLPEVNPHPKAALTRSLVRYSLAALAIAVPLGWFYRPGLVAAILLLALGPVRGVLAYEALGHSVKDGVLVARQGGLRRRTYVTTWERTESTRLRSTPLQRMSGLATLKIDLPSGKSVEVVDAETTELAAIATQATKVRPVLA